MAKKKYKQIKRRPPLSDRQKQLFLSVCIRLQLAFNAVRHKLKAEHFNMYENGYSLVWECACDHFDQYAELPTKEVLLGELERRLESEPDLLAEEEYVELEEWLDGAYELQEHELDYKVALSLAQDFLSERLIDQAKSVLNDNVDIPVNIEAVFRELNVAAGNVVAISAGPVSEPFSENWEPSPLGIKSTGLVFVDTMLNGGHAPKEALGVLGPFGSCKTTLLVQLSVETARMERAKWIKAGRTGPLGMVYYVQYEEAVDPFMLIRGLSYGAQVRRDTFDHYDRSLLSTSKTLKEYELNMFAAQIAAGIEVPGEDERIRRTQKLLNTNWRPLDMSGGDKHYPNRGTGLMPELAAVIEADIQQHKDAFVAAVFVDYAKIACMRYLSANDMDYKDMRFLLGEFPARARDNIAKPFDCPIWIAQQLSGTANSYGPGRAQHHSDASESKSFAENLDISFAIGSVTAESLCLFSLTKGRRVGRTKDAIIRIDGSMSAVRDTGNSYMLDPSTRQFVKADDYHRVVDVPPSKDGIIKPPSNTWNYRIGG